MSEDIEGRAPAMPDPRVLAALSQALCVWAEDTYSPLSSREMQERDPEGYGLIYRILREIDSLIEDMDSDTWRINAAREWISERASRNSE